MRIYRDAWGEHWSESRSSWALPCEATIQQRAYGRDRIRAWPPRLWKLASKTRRFIARFNAETEESAMATAGEQNGYRHEALQPLRFKLRDTEPTAPLDHAAGRKEPTRERARRRLTAELRGWLPSPPGSARLLFTSRMVRGHQRPSSRTRSQKHKGQTSRLYLHLKRVGTVTMADGSGPSEDANVDYGVSCKYLYVHNRISFLFF